MAITLITPTTGQLQHYAHCLTNSCLFVYMFCTVLVTHHVNHVGYISMKHSIDQANQKQQHSLTHTHTHTHTQRGRQIHTHTNTHTHKLTFCSAQQWHHDTGQCWHCWSAGAPTSLSESDRWSNWCWPLFLPCHLSTPKPATNTGEILWHEVSKCDDSLYSMHTFLPVTSHSR